MTPRPLLLLVAAASAHNLIPNEDKVLNRITFSSCMHQDPAGFGDDTIYFQSWDTFAAAGADLAIFTGDNVYGDCSTAECTELKAAYAALAAIPAFQRFKAQVRPTVLPGPVGSCPGSQPPAAGRRSRRSPHRP